ncbi:MAG: TolC family protein [Alphaproteobacteria bacterium]|nr:TolC family protein [Alphaproteobacteria bacterium]
MKTKYIALCSASLLGLCMQPTVVHAETLENAVQAAVASHPAVATAEAQSHQAAQKKREEFSGFFPEVSAYVLAGRIYGDNATSRGLSVTRGAGYSNLGEGSITAREKIFDGFETWNRVKAAGSRKNSADLNLADVKENLAYKTAQAYIELMRVRAGLVSLRGHEKKIDDYLSRIRKKVDEGGADEAEHQQGRDVRVILDGLLADYEGQARAAEANYFNMTGRLPDEKLEKPVPPLANIPEDMETALGQARRNNAALRSAQWTAQSAIYDTKAEKGMLYPDLEAELSALKSDKEDIIGGEVTDERAIMRLSWDLETGGAQLARISQKRGAQKEAVSRAEETGRQIELGVNLAWSEYETAKRQLANQKKRIDLNQLLFKTYTAQFDGGKIGLLQLMQADNQLFTAGLEEQNGQYRLMAAQYAVLASMGRLQESLVVANNPSP